jgi:DNA-binding response OmpR family regulator
MTRKIISEFLKEFEFEMIECEDGKCACNALGDQDKIDLVITDILMPEMDGWHLIKELRNNEAHKNAPVIVVTGASEIENISDLFELGGIWFFNKPFQKEKLVQLVGSLVN